MIEKPISPKLERLFLIHACVLSVLVVIFQTQRFWYMFDYSFVLENAYRMTFGISYYKSVLFPYPPGTFLCQALIIKLFGSTLYPQIVYCCLISVLTYLLTFRILLFFNDSVYLNLALSLPVAITGGYGLISFPYYDQDSTFFILLALYYILYCYQNSFPARSTFLAGILVVIPSFFKQNTGFAFLILMHLAFVITLLSKRDKVTVRNYLTFALGTVISAVILLLYIHLSSGIGNYFYSTISIPKEIRLPSPQRYLSIFWSFVIIRGVVAWMCVLVLLRYFGDKKILLKFIALLLVLSPAFFVPAARWIFLNRDYFVQFLTIWPISFEFAFIVAVYSLFKLPRIPLFLKLVCFVIILLINAAFLAQGYEASHFGIWPLLIILFGLMLYFSLNSTFSEYYPFIRMIFVVNSIALTISLLVMLITNYHLRAVYTFDPWETPDHSQIFNLKGLSIPGEQISDLDGLIIFIKDQIPVEEQFMLIPAEDPIYFATGRSPNFPLYMYDWTIMLYKPNDIIKRMKQYNVKWMIIKTDLQAKWIVNWRNLDALLVQLKKEFTFYKAIPGYEIYRR